MKPFCSPNESKPDAGARTTAAIVARLLVCDLSTLQFHVARCVQNDIRAGDLCAAHIDIDIRRAAASAYREHRR